MTETLFTGDAREVLAGRLWDGTFHACITSPPYWRLRSYLPADDPAKAREIGQEATVGEYVAHLVEVFREVRRTLRDDGTCWLVLGDSYASTSGGSNAFQGGLQRWREHARTERKRGDGLKPKDLIGVPWRVALALQDDGWYLRSEIIWAKPNPTPSSVTDRVTVAHEHVFVLAKSPRYYWDAFAIAEPCVSGRSDLRKMSEGLERLGGKTLTADDPAYAANRHTNLGRKRAVGNGATRNARSVWTIPTVPFKGAHFATFPPRLVERAILASTSAAGACRACGAPAVRLLTAPEPVAGRTSGNLARKVADGEGRSRLDTHLGSSVPWQPTAQETLGWGLPCGHPHDLAPCVVLDPFGGSGTVAQVARATGRDAVYIDLHQDYPALARRRLGEAS